MSDNFFIFNVLQKCKIKYNRLTTNILIAKVKENKTKELIKKSAIELFFLKGKFDANSKDIADLAGVKRPLIYYYFNSVDDLMLTVIIETNSERDRLINNVLNEDSELVIKLDKIFDLHLKYTINYPFRQVYIATHVNLNQSNDFMQSLDYKNYMKLNQLFKNAIDSNLIRVKDPIQAIILFLSYLNYPIIMASWGKIILSNSELEYIEVLKNRKKTFLNLLF